MINLKQKNSNVLKKAPMTVAAFVAAVSNVIFLGLPQINKSLYLTLLMCGIILISSSFIILINFKALKFQPVDGAWLKLLIFIFPFAATLLILENQNSFWIYMYFMATLFFLIDVIKSSYLDILVTASIACAFTIEWLFAPKWHLSEQLEYFYAAILGCILFGSYNQYKFKKYSEGQIQRLRLFGGAVAHELRTPLATIMAGMHGLKRALPIFIEAYHHSTSKLSPEKHFESYQLEALQAVPDTVMKTAQGGSRVIDMILMKVKNDNAKLDYNMKCSAQNIINEAIASYSFDTGEKEKITIHQSKDFEFYSNHEAIKHVIFNLLKNALYLIAHHQKGTIEIWLTQTSKYRAIHFKDTAIGIREEDLIHLFEESHQISQTGTGIGLPFCKLVVENSGGIIECKSIYTQYTEFVLKFPITTKDK